jgi:hypothetical protein
LRTGEVGGILSSDTGLGTGFSSVIFYWVAGNSYIAGEFNFLGLRLLSRAIKMYCILFFYRRPQPITIPPLA